MPNQVTNTAESFNCNFKCIFFDKITNVLYQATRYNHPKRYDFNDRSKTVKFKVIDVLFSDGSSTRTASFVDISIFRF